MGPLAQNSMEKEKKYKIIKIDTGKSKTHTGKNTHLNQNKDILYIHHRNLLPTVIYYTVQNRCAELS